MPLRRRKSRGYCYGSIIGSDNDTFNDIEEFIKRAHDSMINEMDTPFETFDHYY